MRLDLWPTATYHAVNIRASNSLQGLPPIKVRPELFAGNASIFLDLKDMRSRKDIWRCIEEFVASCDNLENDNVVAFR
jgi:hypothetical protein